MATHSHTVSFSIIAIIKIASNVALKNVKQGRSLCSKQWKPVFPNFPGRFACQQTAR